MNGRPFPSIGVVIAGVWLACTNDAAAYVDPGSSSYLFQLLIGGLTAMAFFFGTLRRRVWAGFQWLFRRRNPGPAKPVPPPAVAPDA